MSDESERPEPEFDLVGRVVERRYRVSRLVGEGGMGRVFVAEDQRLPRQVVLKVPHAHLLADRGFRTRFKREITSLIGLEHPHVVKVLDVGVIDRTPFALLQFLGGGTLEDRLQAADEGLTTEQLLEWLPEIAGALDFIHRRGYLHRDVKPANIMFDDDGHAYLGDFGIVRLLRDQDSSLTSAGLIGSPRYMAPEAALDREYGPAYDQYSLAVVLYLCLSGQPPHEASSPMGLVTKKAMEPPRPLLEAAPSQSPAVAAVIERALSREPDERFESCAAFARAFERAAREAPEPEAEPPRARAAPAVEEPLEPARVESAAPVPAVGEAAPRAARRSGGWLRASLGLLALSAAAALGWTNGPSWLENQWRATATVARAWKAADAPVVGPKRERPRPLPAAPTAAASEARAATNGTPAAAAAAALPPPGEPPLAEELVVASASTPLPEAGAASSKDRSEEPLIGPAAETASSAGPVPPFAASSEGAEPALSTDSPAATVKPEPPPSGPEVLEASAAEPASSELPPGEAGAAVDLEAAVVRPEPVAGARPGESSAPEPRPELGAEGPAAPASTEAPAPTKAPAASTDELLAEARALEDGWRLTTGKRHAVGVYREVLAREPDRTEALAGLARIQSHFAAKAREAAASRDAEALEGFRRTAVQVLPGSALAAELASLQPAELPPAAAPPMPVELAELEPSPSPATAPPAAPAESAGGPLRELARNAAGRRVFERTIDGARVVLVPGASFVMGGDDAEADARPGRRVTLSAVLIDEREVTFEQLAAWMRGTGGLRPHRMPTWEHDPSHPVVNATWQLAADYCGWAGGRLPTEAEWEQAARGSDGRAFPWGPAFDGGRANWKGGADPWPKTAPVGSFSGDLSAHGLLDMGGNVTEWVADRYSAKEYSRGPARDPRGPETGAERVYRGGNWNHAAPERLRATRRGSLEPNVRYATFGFRCAMDVPSALR